MSHSGGYFTETEYEVFSVFPPMNPAHMSFLTAFKGVRAPDFIEPFSYCELGSGQGYNLAMLAAMYPNGRFVGVDFSGPQVKRAQDFAAAAGLDNVVFLEASFADFAEVDAVFDVIALHGVWTWVSREVRDDILRLVDRMLAPGGLLHVSMNTMPGWAAAVPFQRMIMDMWRASRDPGEVRAAFKAFYEREPRAAASKRAQQIVGASLTEIESYFAHEFINESWAPVYFHDVAAELAPLGLAFAAGGRPRDVIDRLNLTTVQREHLATVADIGWREMLKDFYRDETFRQDNFVRGPAELTQSDQYLRLASCPVALLSEERARLDVVKAAGEDIRLDAAIRGPWLERLAMGPATVHELLVMPCVEEAGLGAGLQTLLMMWSLNALEIGFGDAHDGEVHRRCARFNAAALDLLADHKQVQLASPVLRAPVLTDLKDRAYLRALKEGRDPVDEILRLAERTGGEVKDNGKVITSKAAMRTAAMGDFRGFERGRLVILRQLGVAEAPAGGATGERQRA